MKRKLYKFTLLIVILYFLGCAFLGIKSYQMKKDALATANLSKKTSEKESIQESVIKFSDPVIEQAIRKKIGKVTGEIYKTDVESITDLEIIGENIESLDGIENLKNLTELNLNNAKIRDIDALSNLTNLTKLELNCNRISNIDALGNLTNLTRLDLRSNKISDISALRKLSKLTSLYLLKNPIDDYSPVSKYYEHLDKKDF